MCPACTVTASSNARSRLQIRAAFGTTAMYTFLRASVPVLCTDAARTTCIPSSLLSFFCLIPMPLPQGPRKGQRLMRRDFAGENKRDNKWEDKPRHTREQTFLGTEDLSNNLFEEYYKEQVGTAPLDSLAAAERVQFVGCRGSV